MRVDVAVTESGVELGADSSRVITRFFVPGREDVGPGDSRAAPVIDRVLRLDEQTVHEAMQDLGERFAHRHRALDETFRTHAGLVTSRLDSGIDLSTERIRLLGASFTHEYAIEGAALCNPSAVLHPHQDDSGDVAFVMSVRGIGEGHRSSIGFRTGTISASGRVTVDRPGAFPQTSAASAGIHHSSVFHARLDVLDDDRENAAFVLGPLPELFVDADLDAGIDDLVDDRATRRNTSTTIANLRSVARSSYRAEFTKDTELSERVLWPHSPAESHGMEDARFVRFADDAGGITYYATYTAFDGANIAQHLLETVDFTTFMVSPMAGDAASGKGLALFPRMVGGRYAALSRSDRETNAIAYSDDLRCWRTSELIQVPERSWELLQLGNCGSPIETKAGWLVLTHGVGPMRTYSLGAILLDLDDPRRVLARSSRPIITPGNDRRDGYVPNVVYTCGGFAHNDTLVLPYGIGDQRISVVTLSIDELLGSLQPEV
jgi:predicted GH43/DUF377 family glycosyl hydrolase